METTLITAVMSTSSKWRLLCLQADGRQAFDQPGSTYLLGMYTMAAIGLLCGSAAYACGPAQLVRLALNTAPSCCHGGCHDKHERRESTVASFQA